MADFDDLLNLEEDFYNEGHSLGLKDGEEAGRMEGRTFGLEKGFEKYLEMGKLHGRCLVWNARCPALRVESDCTSEAIKVEAVAQAEKGEKRNKSDFTNNPRLEKHLRVLYALTEPESLATENTEEAVSDFDDRYKRALGKVKVIERSIGEETVLAVEEVNMGSAGGGSGSTAGQNIEDVDILKARH